MGSAWCDCYPASQLPCEVESLSRLAGKRAEVVPLPARVKSEFEGHGGRRISFKAGLGGPPANDRPACFFQTDMRPGGKVFQVAECERGDGGGGAG